MKKLFFFGSLLLMLSCQKQSENVQATLPAGVSLTSPKGFAFALSANDLKERIQSNAISAFGNKPFDITKIEYVETDKQIAALVEFASKEGQIGTVLLVGNVPASARGGRTNAVMLVDGSTTVDCSGGCDAAGATCRERVILAPDHTITYECTCAGSCKMTIS